MQTIRITKENNLQIPIGTNLHFNSFYDFPRAGNPILWDCVSCFIGQLNEKLVIFHESEIYPNLKGSYITIIRVSNCKTLVEGDTYYKVYTTEDEARYHKLENNGTSPALVNKVYKDVVHSNTNSDNNGRVNRFATEHEAQSFINSLSKQTSTR